MRLQILIPGRPQAKARPRFAVSAKTGKSFTYTPKGTNSWETHAASVFALEAKRAALAIPLRPPLMLTVYAVVKRPKDMCRNSFADGVIWRPAKPDADNILKTVCDAITKSGIISDDRHIVDCLVKSCWGSKEREEYTLSILESIDDPCDIHGPLEIEELLDYQDKVQNGNQFMDNG